ncbi:MAG: hypothetical protein J5602_12185 [Clostridia bacterium]|nr:hypothetical protein [Clostridia bacterium]
MACYISFDGGGTKLNGMMFDENLNLLGTGRSGGINLTQTSLEDCRANVRDCLAQVLAAHEPEMVDVAYYTGVGNFQLLCEEVGRRVHVAQYVGTDEAQGGLLAGALKREGVLALAGTGSDVFYISPGKRSVVGAWGPILGDDGSGAWIGQQAIRAVVRFINGWGEDTLLLPIIREAWKLKNDWQMVEIVHHSPAPFRQVASVTPLVGRAAAQGDRVALNILREAGHLMAVQTESLIRRAELREDQLDITLCGGAWKAHPMMFGTYCAELKENHPALTVHRPLFEHVCAGPARLLLESGVPRGDAIRLMKRQFAQYRVDMSDET